MGILTNLLQLSWRAEDERRNQEIQKWTSIAQMPGVRPEIASTAIDNLISMAPPKAKGLKDIGDLFKGLIGKQLAGADPAQQRMQAALASTGRPATSLPIPGGSQIPPQTTTMGGGPGGPMIGGQPVPAPPEIQTTRPGVNMSEMVPPSQSQVGEVRPSAMLSPQEQFAMKLDEVRQTERVKNEMADIFQAHRDQMEVDKQDRLDQQTLKSFQYYKNVFKGAGLSDREAEDRAGSLLGRPMPRETASQLTGTLGEMAKAQEIVAHPDQHTSSEVKAAQEYITKETKTGAAGLGGNLGERAKAQDIVDNPSKHTPSEVKAARDFLTKENRAPSTVIQMGETKSEAEDVAAAIMRGEQPPTVSGFGMARLAPKVRQILAKNNFPLARAELDWTGMQQYYRSLNSAQQLRLRQATEFATESLNLIHNPKDQGNDLIGQLRRFIPRTKFPILNKAALGAARQGAFGDAAASAARQFDVQIADLQSELATVYRGGNAATNASLERATQMLAGEWSENTLRDAVDLAQRNLGIRLNSIRNVGPGAPGGGGLYAPLSEPPAAVDTTPVNRAAQPSPPAAPGGKLEDFLKVHPELR